MDRLVKPDVKEVEISYKRSQKSTTTFRLSNLMHTMSVAVSLTTTNPSVFSITQSFSIIQPLSTSSYSLTLSHAPDHPPLRSPPDIITVKSAMLPTGKAHTDDLRRLFSRPGPHIFRDATIPISLVGPHVAEYLIPNHALIADLNSNFNRAISGCNGSQLTALLLSAVRSGNPNMVAKLIDVGGDVNCKDSDGRSMITDAVKAGNMEVVRVLIASGCVIDYVVDKVLHDAAAINRVDVMQVLLSNFKDIDVNSMDLHGRTPIHVAASCGNVEAIRFCGSIGGRADVVDFNGSTPLHLAAEKGDLDTVVCLLDRLGSGLIKYAVNKQGKTAFAIAFENGNSHLYSVLQFGDVLHRSARLDDVNAIKNCISEGVNVNERDQNGWSPLHRAAFKGRIESVRMLLNHGARVDVVDDEGYSPLHCAVETGHVQVALLLISHGAKADVKNLKGTMASKKHASPLKQSVTKLSWCIS
ncbi:Protein VAPYRIN-LIKE [Euphorbia peplus]|nr:Protein VAPYRIN-LIKE [Euphorbia peplus]